MIKKENQGFWNAGDTIYKKGDPPECAYLVISGVVEFLSSEKVILGEAGVNEVFGEISCYLNRNHSVTAKAKTNLVVKKILKTELKKIIKKTNPVIIGMLRSTYHRLADLNLKHEKNIKEIDRYSSMFEETSAYNEKVKNRIDTIQEKLDKVNTNNSESE